MYKNSSGKIVACADDSAILYNDKDWNSPWKLMQNTTKKGEGFGSITNYWQLTMKKHL